MSDLKICKLCTKEYEHFLMIEKYELLEGFVKRNEDSLENISFFLFALSKKKIILISLTILSKNPSELSIPRNTSCIRGDKVVFRTELATLKRTPKIHLKNSYIWILCIKIRKDILVLYTFRNLSGG